MMTRTRILRICCWVLLALVSTASCAPRSKHHSKSNNAPQTVYDQKQTGDYNIQLHLKDFQIIALLGDDIGALGDYDYNYEYSDFTVKPATNKPSTTPSPPPTSSPIPQTSSSTIKSTNHPYPILQPSTTQASQPPKETPIKNQPQKPIIETAPQSNQSPDETASASSQLPSASSLLANSSSQLASSSSQLANLSSQLASASSELASTPSQPISTSSTLSSILNEADKTEKAPIANSELGSSTTKRNDLEELNSPGKIKVQILETPVNVVPGEEGQSGNVASAGDIVQLRRCATGFARDKKGRCRRVRRPVAGASQLPYNFGRLASNLVSRFRHTPPLPSDSSLSSFETSEE